MPICPRCQQSADEEDAFCRKCGANLKPDREPQVLQSPPTATEERDPFMEDMAADFERRLKDDPNDPDALYNLGLARLLSKQFAEAATCFRRVVGVLPEFADAHTRLAVCLWNLGELEGARQAIAQAASLAPSNRRIAELKRQMGAES